MYCTVYQCVAGRTESVIAKVCGECNACWSNFLVMVHCCLEALVPETVHIAEDPSLVVQVVSPCCSRRVNVGMIVSIVETWCVRRSTVKVRVEHALMRLKILVDVHPVAEGSCDGSGVIR